MVAATTGGASLEKAISLYSPLIDYSAPLLQQTPDPNSSSTTNQLTLQQQQQLLTQVRHHRSAGVNLSQSTPSPPQTTTQQPQSPSTALSTSNHLGNHHHQTTNTGTTSTPLNECSNNFMNSVVHELNAIKLISNSSATGVGQGHPTTSNLNISCRSSNADNSLLFGLANNGGVGVGVGDSNNSISILSNNSCNKHTNLWGQLSSANNTTNITNNNNTLLYNQAAATNISNLWGCSSTSATSAVALNNNNNINQTSNNNPASSHPSLSPSSLSSVRSSQYHSASSYRSNSKESLWTSSQSSPNSNLRDSFYSIKSNASPTSSTTSSAGSTCSSNGGGGGGVGVSSLLSQSTSLWESPLVTASTKLSMDAAATSYASQLNKISNIWEIPNPAANATNICNPKTQRNGNTNNCMNSSFLGQSRDLLFNDLWGNTDGCSAPLNSSNHQQQQQNNHSHPFAVGVDGDSKLQSDTIGSIWRTAAAPSIGAITNRNKSTCPAMKQQQQRPVIGANGSFFTNATDVAASASSMSSSLSAATSSAATATTSASSGSSSCMQLFSEEFLNYLNMIN